MKLASLFTMLLSSSMVLSSFDATATDTSNEAMPAKSAQRIVALAPHIVENLFIIGAGKRIVGTVEYADYPSEANAITRIGGYHGVSLEKLLALEPDLVIAWQGGNKQDDIAKIKALGIPVVFSNAKNLYQLPDELRRLAKLTGLEEAAEPIAKQFSARLQNLQQKYHDAESIRVFYQLWPEPMMSVNKDSWVHQLISVCHVNNVFADADSEYPQLSLENVLHAKPDVIIVPNEKTKQQVNFIDWASWPDIPAGKYQQVISVDADLLHRFTTRVLDGVEQMCDKLDASRQFYQQRK
jgi:vitamin B12 transport system substrate-binding protein